MKVHDVVEGLVRYAERYGMPQGAAQRSVDVLKQVGRLLGRRDVADVSIEDLAQVGRTLRLGRRFSTSRPEAWQRIYERRSAGAQTGAVLPWELSKPVGVLRQRFGRSSLEGKRILELGCGDGRDAVFLASRGAQVTAVDVSPAAIRMARRRARRAGVRCTFVAGDIFTVPLPGRFDLVFDRACLHHVPVIHYEAYRRLVHRRLATGGEFHLVCHAPFTWQDGWLNEATFGLVYKLLRLILWGHSEAFFTQPELRAMFSGPFRIESISLTADDEGRFYRFYSVIMRNSGPLASGGDRPRSPAPPGRPVPAKPRRG